MARRLDRALVIDVESTCWEGPPPRGQISEIIEIGLCTVDLETAQRVERTGWLIRPQRSEISEFCTRLTSLDTATVAGGITLAEAIDRLRDDFRAADRLFVSWGDYDRNQFHRNCDAFGLKYPFGPTHLNVKSLFAAAYALARECGIDTACEIAGVPFDGTHHRGIDDAWNIGELFCRLLRDMRAGRERLATNLSG